MIDEQLLNTPFNEESRNPKELFDIIDIDVKTELSSEQVMIISRMRVYSNFLKKKYGIKNFNNLIESFLKLQVSKDRSSRKEFVDAMKSTNETQGNSLLDKISLKGN